MEGISFKQLKTESELSAITKGKDLFINISFMDYSFGNAKKNIYYVHFPTQQRTGLFNYVLLLFQKYSLYNYLPFLLKERVQDRLKAGIYPDMDKRLASYDTFLTHSEYVADWVEKKWHKKAIVLYPPVKLLSITDQQIASKKNWIVSVGRFFTLGHGKKQEVMIEAFKRSPALNKQYELHLIGGVGKEPSSLRFVQELKEMAKGYPVFFHFNITREEMEDIMLKSKIYWHAGGFGEDREKNPIKFEHFGIAPVEAISAGCIPVLFNGGGLPEIIEKLSIDPNTHLFNSIDELVDKTKKITSLPQRLDLDIFSPKRFTERFLSLVK